MPSVLDQAASLRAAQLRPVVTPGSLPLVAVVSGKGGVGKTFMAVNLSLALAERGGNPLLMDLDWGLANVDVALGLAPRWHAGNVLRGECRLDEALIHHGGVGILPNVCGDGPLVGYGPAQEAVLLDRVRTQSLGFDITVADTHPGLGDRTLSVIAAATLSLVITTPDPTSMTDTYALLKVLYQRPMVGRLGLVVNGASGLEQALEVSEHLDVIARRFLGRGVPLWGFVPADTFVGRSVRAQCAVMERYPAAAASVAVRQLADTVLPLLSRTPGGLH